MGSKTETRKRRSYAAQVQSIIEEGNIQDADLKNINNQFIALFDKFEEPLSASLTVNNPLQYEIPGSQPQAQTNLNSYVKIYHHLVSDTPLRGNVDLQQGQRGFNTDLDRDRLSLRSYVDDLRRNTLFSNLKLFPINYHPKHI